MFPLLPFAAGILAGAAAIRLVKGNKTKATLGKVQDGLRKATVSSLAVIENSSANLRTRLMNEGHAAAQAAEAQAATPGKEAAPEAPPAAKAAPRRKPAARTATGAAPAPRPRKRKSETPDEGGAAGGAE